MTSSPPRPRPIAVVAPGELYGGVERQLLGLAPRLRERGDWDPTLLLFHDAELAAQARDAGIPVRILRTRGPADPQAVRGLAAALDGLGAEVAHLHGYRAVFTAALVARRRPLAAVKTEHGLPEPQSASLAGTLKSRFYHALDTWGTRALDASVRYVTDDIAGRFDAAHRGLDRATLPNGIDPLESGDHARPADLPHGEPVLAVVGRVSEVKGIEYAVDALALPEMPEGARVVVIGDGPSLASLRERARARGVADRMAFLGFQRDVFGYLAHADALLMPSLHEGLPYTLLEAMSLGRPALAARVGGLAEVLRDGETGLLFPPREPAAIAAACRRLADEPGLAARLGAAAAADQRARYSLDGMVDGYAAAYAEALARRSGR